ncbi:aminotransferase class V-fold PLP-dependent enzyme [Marivirga salinae]|uniref:phosphoserine transaminase n=1 Tax=Marivirga salinarum TaxID=3059078 RepID=A0AA51RBN9_9BACT|nr:aminotransferase class V-fold PLP-dependent enzyme [Marivirga sp. BDSF4-3]WMN10713.1 aminotransferase class V-fold PLP-dependent enzyme [Marivirga sp. BDSF4-3]
MQYNFYPGPSKIYPQVAGYFQEAMELGILERNHRSKAFQELFSTTKGLLKSKLNIPLDYEIVMVSSATECWEIISQSFIQNKSQHFFNGAFGEKWCNYTQKILPKAEAISFGLNENPSLQSVENAELLAFTHNETSNGSAISEQFQKQLRTKFSNSLIAYDATSSMAGYELDWEMGDIWYASVQKCFGLPAGMALMVVSPKAIMRAKEIDESDHYNSFNFILKNALDNQTHHTPNIANIFMLNRLMRNVENISAIHQNLKKRKEQFFNELSKLEKLSSIIQFNELQSDTVFCLRGEKDIIRKLKEEAEKEGFILGNGYGGWKENTIRIANFPAIPNQHYIDLINFLLRFDKMN